MLAKGTPRNSKRGWPASRMKRKTPPGDVEWRDNDSYLTYSVMLMRRHLTRRGLEKRQEKELRWSEIPPQFQEKFREAEGKQWREHLHFDALEPLNDIDSKYIKNNVPSERVLRLSLGVQGQKLVEEATRRASRVEVQVKTCHSGSYRPRFGFRTTCDRRADFVEAGQRVCRSTFSAETQACIEGAEAGQHVRALQRDPRLRRARESGRQQDSHALFERL